MGEAVGGDGDLNTLAEVMETALRVTEAKVDKELENLETPGDTELDSLQAARQAQLVKDQEEKQKWIQCGHGEYSELNSETDFFPTVHKSKLTVVHFYRQATTKSNILDKHLRVLAPKHMETRFVKLNAEKCPFLVEKLVIRVLPTILVVIDSQIVDRIIGFTDLGNTDDFTTEVLEWRLGVAKGIHYFGDKSVPPYERKSKRLSRIGKHILDSTRDESDDDEDVTKFLGGSSDNLDKLDLTTSVNPALGGMTASELEQYLNACDIGTELDDTHDLFEQMALKELYKD